MERLIEQIAGESLRNGIEREARLIRDIAMLRAESKNGYRYSAAAMATAAKLFEGAPAYLDHPATVRGGASAGRGAGERSGHSVRDLIGRFTNVRLQGELVRGDLHLLPGPEADKILALAEEMPSAVGFSIEAQGTLAVQEGRKVVTDLTAAKGVALVTEPAATRGLFEGRQEAVGAEGAARSPAEKPYVPPTLQEQVDELRAEDPELYQAVVAAEDRRREAIRATARRQRLTLSESTVAKLAAHGSIEHAMVLLEGFAADLRGERNSTTAGTLSLPARPNDSQTQLEGELSRRLIAAD